jgi:hypothetical protein
MSYNVLRYVKQVMGRFLKFSLGRNRKAGVRGSVVAATFRVTFHKTKEQVNEEYRNGKTIEEICEGLYTAQPIC